MSRTTTQVLKVRLETENFTAGRTAFQGLASDAKAAGAPFQQLNTQMQQVDKTTTSVGAKLKNFGASFGRSITTVGALGGQVFGLTRQYQDLQDTQIRVDRTTLKLSRTNEAVSRAQTKLNEAVAKYGKGSKEAQQASLDLQQAMDAQKLATTMLGEAQEDQQRAYEDFWLGLGPTIATAGASIMSVISDLKGAKGFGGLTTAVEAATSAVVGGGGGKGGGGKAGLIAALTRLGGVAGPAALVGGGLFGAGALQKALGPDQIKIAQASGAQDLAMWGKTLGLTRDQIMGLRASIEQFNNIFGLTTATVEQVDAAIKKLNPTLKETDQATKNVAQSMTATVQPGLASFAKFLAENEAAYRNGQKTYQDYLTSVDNAAAAMHVTQQEAIDLGMAGIVPLDQKVKALAKTVSGEATPALEGMALPIQGMAQQVQYLDANFQPLHSSFNLLVGSGQTLSEVLAQANTNLSKLPQYIDPITAAIDRGVASVDQWIASEKEKIAQDAQMQRTFLARAKALGNVNLTEKSSIETIKLWIDYTIAAQQGNTKLAQTYFELYKKANLAEQGLKGVTGAAKAITYGALLPGDKKIGIPKGGRSGELRIRSDYVRPLIGSPEAQRQMLAGTRPAVYGEHSAKLAKMAADANKAADSYKGAVGKITAANKTLQSSLGNMPASLLPVNNAAKAIPKSLAPANVAIKETATALKNIPKVTAPKVTATVVGKPQVDSLVSKIAQAKSKTVTLTTVLRGQLAGVKVGSGFKLPGHQHGYEGIARGPSLFMAGEGGRRERVSVHPIGSASDRGGRGGGGDVYVGPIYLDGEQIMGRIRYKINANQGIFK